jgi:SAM-dependent methyltransferase
MTTPNTPGTAEQEVELKWNRAWSTRGPGEILWEADPADIEADLGYFVVSLDQALPIVDFGCGDGRQTRFLAPHFAHVVGVDISEVAIRRALAEDNPPNVGFQVLDARHRDGVSRLHSELGDANVYIRGMLHSLPPDSRSATVQTITLLLGAAGTLFVKEPSPDAAPYFTDITERYVMPPGQARMMSRITSAQLISIPELTGMFPADRFEVLNSGTTHLRTVHTLPGGGVVSVPAIWILSRPRGKS